MPIIGKWTFVANLVPMRTLLFVPPATWSNIEPERVMVVPPSVGPSAGLMPINVGGAKLKVSEFEVCVPTETVSGSSAPTPVGIVTAMPVPSAVTLTRVAEKLPILTASDGRDLESPVPVMSRSLPETSAEEMPVMVGAS